MYSCISLGFANIPKLRIITEYVGSMYNVHCTSASYRYRIEREG